MFNKILIANRGEIAVRVIKACKELGIPTVAIFSTVDRNSLHVQMADEAVLVGPPAPLESYLNIDNIISIAKNLKVDAIHPGYGFLAENPVFAERCEKEGIVFIGSDSKSLALVGDKLRSRETMQKAGIPIIPGMKGSSKDINEFKKEAKQIGYPVILKASGGGGGKGMRKVCSEDELESSISAGMREARSAFGDDSVYLEKYIQQPRHIEFQVLADKYGNVVHLFERECSIQRRHQKIVEETPSVALDDSLRKKMGETAVKAIMAANYSNAGTVEFLLDKDKNFYFLEVNARIQVEHPITELVVGVDLVKAQIRLASGDKMFLKQEQLKQRGHAIECRIYAEDPENNFLPCSGKILFMKEPTGPGIRHDCGIYTGFEVSVYYDPILSKLIVWAEDRPTAIRRMLTALSDLTILGIKSTTGFLKDVVSHSDFLEGKTTTDFIPKNFTDWKEKEDNKKYLNQALIATAIISQNKFVSKGQVVEQKVYSPWQALGKWEIGMRN
jgi:acetyl-CoA carboxylase biotin carboxylase subunit